MDLAVGSTAAVELTVGDADTAIAHRSGDVPALATPRLIALCEEAAVAAIAGHLDDTMTTVGTAIHLEHRAPSFVGAIVLARATLESIHGHRLRFRLEVLDGPHLAATGTLDRTVVDRATFLAGTA